MRRDHRLICFSHLRWNFVYQRPQHLMSRFARLYSVYFIEEPVMRPRARPHFELKTDVSGVTIGVPVLPERCGEQARVEAQSRLMDGLMGDQNGGRLVLWYYTPMALPFTRHLNPGLCVYDCMDELSTFLGAPPAMRRTEAELLARADLVFAGGQSLYEAKRRRHPRVHAFPSSVEVVHFARARGPIAEPADQAELARPRLGFSGVIDERMDLDLVRGIAEARPAWQLVMVGPVVKIAPGTLPRAPNIHYLGLKRYDELPAYLSGWDIALMPFALNEATRFISPTKTPEYLAAAKPVISTPIRDVARLYGELDLVTIGRSAADFVASAETLLARRQCGADWLERVDSFLGRLSWDCTAAEMLALIQSALDAKERPGPPRRHAPRHHSTSILDERAQGV
jgi:UDP-galactopyranose mutase